MNSNVNAVLVFSFLGIMIGLLALTRCRAAQERVKKSNLGFQFLEIVRPSQVMAMTALLLSVAATIFGFMCLIKGLST